MAVKPADHKRYYIISIYSIHSIIGFVCDVSRIST